ncbi:MAG: adenosylmethionine--8-amino-7-oxononanoate transaminase [Planctomycetota bacterium]
MEKIPEKLNTETLREKDYNYIWHPFTQMMSWFEEDAPIIESGKGVYLIDSDGNKYIDGISSLWVNVHGHKRKEIDSAVINQLNKIAHSTFLGLSNIPAIELAEKLVEIAPHGLTKVFYSDNGSTAVEIALKMAFQYYRQNKPFSKKNKFLHFTSSYHGDTIGSVSVGGLDLFHNLYKPLLFESVSAPYPYCYRCAFRKKKETCKLFCLNEVEKVIEKHSTELAAVIIEPLIQGAAGMITMPRGYLSQIRKLCDRYRLLLICDEVATGFGRTGEMFASQHEDVSPDFLCIAKGLTGGYIPVAATLTTTTIFEGFLGQNDSNRTFFHGHTYTANPLGCAAALANLELFKTEKTLQRLQPKIKLLTKELEKFNELEHVGDIRQCGFMCGIELVQDKKTKKQFKPALRTGLRVIVEARRRGVILRPLGDTIVIMPPLIITAKELSNLLKVTFESIRTVTEQA